MYTSSLSHISMSQATACFTKWFYSILSKTIFFLIIRSKCQLAYFLASYELFLSLRGQLVQRHFYGMLCTAKILCHHIGLLKKYVSLYIIYVHLSQIICSITLYLKLECYSCYQLRQVSYLQLFLTDRLLIWC